MFRPPQNESKAEYMAKAEANKDFWVFSDPSNYNFESIFSHDTEDVRNLGALVDAGKPFKEVNKFAMLHGVITVPFMSMVLEEFKARESILKREYHKNPDRCIRENQANRNGRDVGARKRGRHMLE